MIPLYDRYGFMAAVLGGMLLMSRSNPPSKEKLLLRRLDAAEANYLKRLASPEVAAAQAKRERKAARLRRIEGRQ